MQNSIIHLERIRDFKLKHQLVKTAFAHLEDRLSHFQHPGLEGEDDVGVVRSKLDLHQAPNTCIGIGELH